MILSLVGLLFIFAVPGFFISQILFQKTEILEKILLTVLLSIGFYVVLGLFLGYNEMMKNITGGLSAVNVWAYSIIINVVLGVIYLVKSRKKVKHKVSKSAK